MKKLVLILVINVIVFTICIGQTDSTGQNHQIVNQNFTCPEDTTLTTNEIIQGNATEGEVISPCSEIIQGNRKEHLLEPKKDPSLDRMQYEIKKNPKSETNPRNLFSPPVPVNLIGVSTKKNLPSNDNDLTKINMKSKNDPISGTRDWETICAENFEGSFPNTFWQCYAASGPDAYWDDQSYLSHNGNWSAWCADGGSQGLPALGSQYLDNMNANMKYGPFDLSDASDAQVLFHYWLDSEYNYDYLQWFASVNNNNWYGYQVSGNSGGWTSYNFDLTNVPTIGNLTGEPQVWVKWKFISDGSIHNYMGAYVDDILIEKDVPPGNVNLDLTGGSFSPNPCAIDADLSIDAEITNNGTAPANNILIEYYLSTNTIISQSDYYVGSDYVTLSPGQSGWEYITQNLSNVSDLTPGLYYVGVYMDAQGSYGGYWYWTTQLEVTPVGNIDLALTGGSFSPNPCAIDADFTIDAEIFNNGTAPANNVLIEYYLSTNTIISQSDYYVGSDYVTLNPGQYGWEYITENLSNVSGLTTGFYYVGVYFDAQGPNGGYGFFSNQQLEVIQPGYIDLDLTGGSFSPNPCAIDAVLTIDAEITNNGTAPAYNVLIEYYLSENTYISQSDYYVGSDYVTLSPGQSGWEYITQNLSNVSDLTPGLYYVGVYFDSQCPNGGYSYWNNQLEIISTSVNDNLLSQNISDCSLSENYPNPFNPETTIEYNLNENSNVQIEIFNTKGQKVKTLIDDFKNAGYHQVIWNGTDNQNKPVSSGLYFYRLKTNSFSQIRKMLLLK